MSKVEDVVGSLSTRNETMNKQEIPQYHSFEKLKRLLTRPFCYYLLFIILEAHLTAPNDFIPYT